MTPPLLKHHPCLVTPIHCDVAAIPTLTHAESLCSDPGTTPCIYIIHYPLTDALHNR